RNESLGKDALTRIVDELSENRTADIRSHQLDITNEESCRYFAEHLRKEHSGLDVLINNAGYSGSEEEAELTIGINYYGTKRISEHLTPLMRSGGRIVNVCSQAGVMGPLSWASGVYGQERIDRFKDPNLQVSEVDSFVEEYKRLAKDGKQSVVDGGFPESAYRISKAAEVALTMIQARKLKSRNILVNACCPGYVATDMTGHQGLLTIEEGADTPIYLAMDPNAPHGQFVYQRQPVDWLSQEQFF
ncbi:oxidoreductaseshort chain dehydrogenase/reductase family protein, partial [Aphelenchoides avenae]